MSGVVLNILTPESIFFLQQPFIKASIFRMSVKARAGLTVIIVMVAVDATTVHLD